MSYQTKGFAYARSQNHAPKTLRLVDKLVQKSLYPNRSRVIQEAVAEKLARIDKSRLARECAKLSPDEERGIAEEGMSEELEQWPKY